jgi:hypothetical protein
MIECHAAGDLFQVTSVLSNRIQQPGDGRFAFSGQHAIHSTIGVPQNFVRNKRDAVAAHTNKRIRQQVTRRSRQINNFGNVRKIIAAERDYIWPPALNPAEIVPVRFALQIDQPRRVPGALRCSGHKLQAKRLQSKINLRIHQTTGMNRQKFHFFTAGRGLFKTILQRALSC